MIHHAMTLTFVLSLRQREGDVSIAGFGAELAPAAGGGGKLGTKTGDAYVAFALPQAQNKR